MKIPFLGQTSTAESTEVNNQLTQNWYPHVSADGVSQLSLYPTPGLKSWGTIGIGPCRGIARYENTMYVVSGTNFYSVDSTGAATFLATLNSTSGRVYIASNEVGEQIAVADGVDFYIWDNSGSDWKIITDAADPDYDADCPTPNIVTFMDGFFIVDDPSISGQFAISGLRDGTAWAGDAATAERSSDTLQNIVPSDRILWLIGSHTAEAWWNSGDEDFPFEPIQSGFSQWGTIARHSCAEMSGSVFWLSQNDEGSGMVVMTEGTLPRIISTPDVSSQIQKMSIISDAYAYTYQHGSHSFYVLSFPTEGVTLVYDIITQQWHTWKTQSTGTHRSTHHIFMYGKHLVGSPDSSDIFELDWDTYKDGTELIHRIRRTQYIHSGDRPTRHWALYIDMEEGTGNSNSPNPQVMIRYKDENAKWSSEKWRSLGGAGAGLTRLVWRLLGRARKRVYELKITDPVRAVVVDAYLSAQPDSRENG